MIIVVRPGPLALLQDLGRPGRADLGVSPSGAADRTALRLANRMVGNPERAAGVECVLGGLSVTATTLHWVVVTGAPTEVVVDERPVGSHTAFALRAGQTLTVRPPVQGLRNYLAVRGGLLGSPVLGSLATDVLSGLGPTPLAPGQTISVGETVLPLPDTDFAPPHQPRKQLQVLPGPRRDWFAPAAWSLLLSTAWLVSDLTDRTATRLRGPVLARVHAGELPSEGLVRGAVQVPSSGQPLIFNADHPVTGGYPVIAVLTERDADHAAQLRPGDTVTFRA